MRPFDVLYYLERVLPSVLKDESRYVFIFITDSLTWFAERLVHLALRAKGAHPILYACPGVKCRKRHREFYPLKVAGGWSSVEDEMVSALKATGQKDIER